MTNPKLEAAIQLLLKNVQSGKVREVALATWGEGGCAITMLGEKKHIAYMIDELVLFRDDRPEIVNYFPIQTKSWADEVADEKAKENFKRANPSKEPPLL